MRLRVAGLVEESVADGPGLRFTVFVQGCGHGCSGCWNPQTHQRDGGTLMEVGMLAERIRENPLLDGLSLSGGEPFDQPEACGELAEWARAAGLHVMAWTGYTFEQLTGPEGTSDRLRLLRSLDLLVDGPFILELRSLELPWRGSANQRVLDVPLSLARGAPVAC